MPKKIYLVYDYEQFCGAYSSFALAKKAVEQHLDIVLKCAQEQAEKKKMGEIQLEVAEDRGKSHWAYLASFKAVATGREVHCSRPTIFECPLDRYDSVIKRLAENSSAKQPLGNGTIGRPGDEKAKQRA
ncbi:MAG: hypothetical protein N3G22_03080 [Candidatus Micrarchaeota archaeon]|nr:hypothetical protein [Candidatus Micrarchaeota archaeon]